MYKCARQVPPNYYLPGMELLRCQLFALCLLGLLSLASGARRVDANVRARETMKRRRETAVMKRQEPGSLDTTELLELTDGESLDEARTAHDVHGTVIHRMEEKYKGLPVLDATVTVSKDKHGKLTGDATGTLIQDIDNDLPDTVPTISDEESLEIVINAENDQERRDKIGDEKFEHLVVLDSKDKARLVSKVSYAIDGVKNPIYMVDLKTGEVLSHWNAFMTMPCCHKSPVRSQLIGGNEKMGKVKYGSQPYCMDFKVDDCDICYLENKYVRVVDMGFTEQENITETASFPCTEVYNDTVNGAYSPAIDAFFHGTVVGMMFEQWYKQTALKEQMIIRVHFGDMYLNAFWNDVNATFGDGDERMMYPLTSLDIVGHEFGHGVVGQNSGLFYYGESGGMNEAFADIMGETSEQFFMESDLLLASTIMKSQPYMREFDNPENDGHSIGKADQMTSDMDPHSSSGVYRRIWYVITKEQGLDFKEAFRVFLHANKLYWHHLSDFYDGSCGLLRAAMDLGVDTAPFAVAFEDVGIQKCDVSSHIVSLTNNQTQRGITVSYSTHPVFGFSAPPWTKSIVVEAISPTFSSTIDITLLKGSWEEEEYDNAESVAEGTTKLEYDTQPQAGDKRKRDHASTESYTDSTSTDYQHQSSTSSDYTSQDTSTASHTSTPPPSSDYSTNDATGSTTITPHASTKSPYDSTSLPYDSTTATPDANTTDNAPIQNTSDYRDLSTPGGYSSDTTYSMPNLNYTTAMPHGQDNQKFFIKLWTDSMYDFDDVELTVGYTCLEDFRADEYMVNMFYRYYCYGDMF